MERYGMMPWLAGEYEHKEQEGLVQARVEQFVTAYRVEPERLETLLPPGFVSLRPVLRINLERLEDVQWLGGRSVCRAELNTPVAYGGKKGWLNLVTWENDMDAVLVGRDIRGIATLYASMAQSKKDKEYRLQLRGSEAAFLDIAFTRVGKSGGCPHESDNDGTFALRPLPWPSRGRQVLFRPVESIDQPKEYCDVRFDWSVPPRLAEPVWHDLLRKISQVPCQEILGAYAVCFDRTQTGLPAQVLD